MNFRHIRDWLKRRSSRIILFHWYIEWFQCTHATSSTPSNITVDTKSASPRSSTTSVMNHNSLRFHPYMKPNNLLPNAISSPLGLPSFPTLPSFPSPAAFQAMYRQGMMATMPHHWINYWWIFFMLIRMKIIHLDDELDGKETLRKHCIA